MSVSLLVRLRRRGIAYPSNLMAKISSLMRANYP